MDAKSAQVVVPSLSEPFKYQTWFLKVSIHCEGCRRKVKKVLQSIDGVFTTTVDPQQQKVTVTGSIGVETLIRKLVKAGKHAEIWPEKQQEQKQQQQQQQKKKKKNEQGEAESVEKNSTKTNAEPNSTKSSKKKGTEKNGENGNAVSKSSGKSKSGGGGESEAAEAEKKGGESEGGKKKKGSGGSEVQMNLSPTRQQSYVYEYPESYFYPPNPNPNPMVYLATTQNNRLCPSYYVSPIYDPYRLQSPPFEIFSDENANACSIM